MKRELFILVATKEELNKMTDKEKEPYDGFILDNDVSGIDIKETK
jgi:hypothetical protein